MYIEKRQIQGKRKNRKDIYKEQKLIKRENKWVIKSNRREHIQKKYTHKRIYIEKLYKHIEKCNNMGLVIYLDQVLLP